MEYKKILQLRRKYCQLVICHDTHPNNVNDNNKYHNDINNIDTDKTMITATMIRSLMMSITVINILKTSTTMVQTTTRTRTLIQRTILIIPSFAIIANSVKVLISIKNMANLCHMLLNSFKNLAKISSEVD